MQLENGEVLTPEQGKALWDEVAAEKAGGTPPAKPAKTEPVAEPEVVNKAAPEVDPIKDLREMIERIDHRTKSAEGRIGAIDREHKLMQETLAAASKAAAQVSDAPTQAQMDAAAGNKEKWDALEQKFPEWTKAFEHRLSLIPQFDSASIEKMVEERIKGASATVEKKIINNTLDAVYPGWEDEVKTEQFGKWVKSHPEWKPEFEDATKLSDPQSALAKFVSSNPNSPVAMYFSSKVGDAARMLRLYEASKSAETTAANLTQQRQQTLNSATGAPKRGVKTPAVKSVEDMSPQELWNHEARLRDQKRSRGY